MPNVSRRTDRNTAGGSITGPCSPNVFINGLNVSLPNDSVTPHPCCGSDGCGAHCSAKTTGGSPTVFANGQPVIRISDTDTCGHGRGGSFSPDVFVE